jgi:hypothetical protein
MRTTQILLLELAIASLGGCPLPGDDESLVPDAGTPYPGVAVTGTVMDVRGTPVEGAHVVIWNRFDAASADTGTDGTFALTLDGDSAASRYTISHPGLRPAEGSVAVGPAGALGNLPVMSKDEILFSTYEGDLHMVRAGGGAILPVATSADQEIAPSRSASGMTVRYANVTAGTVLEAPWDGSSPSVIYTVDGEHTLTGMAWSEAGTFAGRARVSDGAQDVILVEFPPGGIFSYSWPGESMDDSPPAFGSFGPTPIHGNMLCFSGTVPNYHGTGVAESGLFTAFPYFDNSFLVPEKIGGTAAGDLNPRWSAYRADESLDLAFQRGYGIYLTHVTADDHQNLFSTPALIYGDGTDDVNVGRLAWAPATDGAPDRIAFAVNALSSGSTFAGPGDVVVITYDQAAGVVTGASIAYDADQVGNVGKAIWVDWK